MRKIYVLALSFAAIIGNGARADVLLDLGFDGGEAPGVSMYDVDGLTPSFFMRSLGFRVDKPWVSLLDSNTSTDYCYGSTSQYEPAGQANDWLVMPALAIAQEGYILQWDSQAFDAENRDGLKVFISTEGPEPDKFPAEPVWQIEEEEAGPTQNFEGEFVTHSISLDVYAGQTVYIAFVNQSYDKSIIAIDNIKVARDVEVSLEEVSRVTEASYAPAGMLVNASGVTIHEVTLSLAYGDATVSEQLSQLDFAYGDTLKFAMQHSIPLTFNEPLAYTLTVTAEGFDPVSLSSQVTYTYNQCVVVEDHTGLWCGNCPAGSWAIDSLLTLYGETHIAPIAVHNGSALAITSYDDALSAKGLSAFPSGWINRTYISEPWGSGEYNFDAPDSWLSLVAQCMEQLPTAGVEAAAVLSEDKTTITATATVENAQALSDVDYRIVFVLTEDSLAGYYQRNYFSGSQQYVGGWESLPPSAPVVLDEVARGIYPSFSGEKGSLPANMDAFTSYEYSYTFAVPESVQRTDKLKVVAMYVDGKTDHVVNAAVVPVGDNTAVQLPVADEQFALRVIVDDAAVVAEGSDDALLTARLYGIDGRLISASTARRSVVLHMGEYSGVALLHITDGTRVRVDKILIRR